jgi:uncharacterized damage-inducible protein DinB
MKLTRKEIEKELRSSKEFFDRSTKTLSEQDSTFSPAKDVMTVSQQVAHVAHTIEWFIDGAFSREGFNLDFEQHAKDIAAVTSLEKARIALDRAFSHLLQVVETTSDADWEQPMAPGLVMGGEPRKNIFAGLIDHTAHHRGALTVYARLLGKVSPMPYMET